VVVSDTQCARVVLGKESRQHIGLVFVVPGVVTKLITKLAQGVNAEEAYDEKKNALSYDSKLRIVTKLVDFLKLHSADLGAQVLALWTQHTNVRGLTCLRT